MAKSQTAVREKWFEIREAMRQELNSRQNPFLWVRLFQDIVDNNPSTPNKVKRKMLKEVLKIFTKTSMELFGWEYLGKLHEAIDWRQHKGYGKTIWYYYTYYGGMVNHIESWFNKPVSMEPSSVPTPIPTPIRA